MDGHILEGFGTRVHVGEGPFQRHGTSIQTVPVLGASTTWGSPNFTIWPAITNLGRKALKHTVSFLSYLVPKSLVPPATIPQDPSAFRLMDLPGELHLMVMENVTPTSLYCLRQTSPWFMDVFNRQQFAHFQQLGDVQPHHKEFYVDMLFPRGKSDVAHILQRHKYCASCLEAERLGILAAGLEELRTQRYCDGCDSLHAGVFFYSGDKMNQDQDGSRLECIGRLGEITLCSHTSSYPTTWSDIEQHHEVAEEAFDQGELALYESACTHRSHERVPDESAPDDYPSLGSPFPRLVAYTDAWEGFQFFIGYAWDLPLLRIDPSDRPTLSMLRQALSNVVVSALRHQRLCPHISADKEIREFVQSGTCNCFTHRGISPASRPGCECERQDTLECHVCGATYKWLFNGEYMVLSYRYAWRIHRPTSPGWLCLLDQEFRDRVFTEDTRHVLWCDTPRCRTNTGRRWESLVKEAAEVEARTLDENGALGSDYMEMWNRSMEGWFRSW